MTTPERSVEDWKHKAVYISLHGTNVEMENLIDEILQAERQKRDEVVEARDKYWYGIVEDLGNSIK